MSDSAWNEIVGMTRAFAIVTAFAVSMAILFARLGRVRTVRRLYRPTTAEALGFALFAIMLPPSIKSVLDSEPVVSRMNLITNEERAAAATCLAIPIWLGLILAWRLMSLAPPQPSRWTRDLRSGCIAFLILTPITFLANFIVLAILLFFGGEPEAHPLTKLNITSTLGMLLLSVSACIGAPLLEESAFRGFLLPWARDRRWRPWLLFAAAVALLLATKGVGHFGAVAFVIDLTVLLAFAAFGRDVWKKWPSRTASSIVATSALFGALHAAVWPSPIPLTVLALGLGILTVRTQSVRPAIIAHALFNAVSVLFVLSR